MTAGPIHLELPPALASQRGQYLRDIETATAHVVRWFAEHELDVSSRDFLDSVVVLESLAEAKSRMSKEWRISADEVPDFFSGGIKAKTLFVLAREANAKQHARMSHGRPWTSEIYVALIAHEMAHQAHVMIAKPGPMHRPSAKWFWEGLAVTCASQFGVHSMPLLSWEQLQELMIKASDSKMGLSYDVYGQMFRSVLARFPLQWLIEHAKHDGFADLLAKEYSHRATRK
jgi:hypothetical protein